MGRAVGFLPDEEGMGPLEALRQRALEIVFAATAKQRATAHRVALGFPPTKARALIDLFAFVEEWLRDLAAIAAGARDQIFNQDTEGRLAAHVAEAGIEAVDIPIAFSKVESARELARGNVNPQLVMTGLMRDLREALVTRASAVGSAR
jgi:hypothetical protein